MALQSLWTFRYVRSAAFARRLRAKGWYSAGVVAVANSGVVLRCTALPMSFSMGALHGYCGHSVHATHVPPLSPSSLRRARPCMVPRRSCVWSLALCGCRRRRKGITLACSPPSPSVERTICCDSVSTCRFARPPQLWPPWSPYAAPFPCLHALRFVVAEETVLSHIAASSMCSVSGSGAAVVEAIRSSGRKAEGAAIALRTL